MSSMAAERSATRSLPRLLRSYRSKQIPVGRSSDITTGACPRMRVSEAVRGLSAAGTTEEIMASSGVMPSRNFSSSIRQPENDRASETGALLRAMISSPSARAMETVVLPASTAKIMSAPFFICCVWQAARREDGPLLRLCSTAAVRCLRHA